LEERIKKIAEKEYAKHPWSDWIKFIRKLVELYNHYTELEKDKLSQELKRLLGSTANMVMMARKIDFMTLCDEYGEGNKSWGIRYIDDIRIYYKGLEKIFPIEINQLRERALSILPSYIKEINKWLPEDTKLSDNFHEQLVSTIIDEGNELLLTHLHEIEDLCFNYKLYWVGSIWAHLRSLTIAVEDVGRQWFAGRYISHVFANAFGDNYKTLRTSYGNNITDASTSNDFVKKLKQVLQDKTSSCNGLCRYYLIVTHLLRNFLSHKNKVESTMIGSLFMEVYRCLILTLVSLFAQKKKTEKMREKVKFGS